MQKDNYRLGYRPDIEGLRAVAVLLVIFCHAGVPGFGGGFIGVDMFFVLSGYLISGLLIKEYSSKGSIDFRSFYLRRLLRLAPALFTMLLVTSGAVYLTIAPAGQMVQYLAAGTAAVWLSNLHFAFGELNYFSPDASRNLFLHTWSLSVEEQFYLFWPALIVAVMKVLGRGSFTVTIRGLATVLLYILLLSLALCLYLSHTDTIAAYYLPTARAWQFATGALALCFSLRQRESFAGIAEVIQSKPSAIMQTMGWAAAGMVALATYMLSETSRYPGIWALMPTLATAMILVVGVSSGRWPISRLLTAKPLIHIGTISYGWYLWHWPALVLAKILFPEMQTQGTAAAIALSFLLAVLSYHLVEKPIRKSRYLKKRPRFAWIATSISMLLIVALQISLLKTSENNVLSPELEKYYAARMDLPVIYAMECDEWVHSAELKRCDFGAESPKHKAILIGDSIAGQWHSAFSGIADQPEWQFTVLTKSSCPMVDLGFFYKKIGRRFLACEKWRENALDEIARTEPDLVIMSTSRNYPFSAQEWETGSLGVLEKIATHVGKIIIVRSTPVWPSDSLDCLVNQAWQQRVLPEAITTRCAMMVERSSHDQNIYDALKLASQPYENVEVVDFNDLVCPKGLCSAQVGEAIVFRDKQHLTDTFVKQITPKILDRAELDPTHPPGT